MSPPVDYEANVICVQDVIDRAEYLEAEATVAFDESVGVLDPVETIEALRGAGHGDLADELAFICSLLTDLRGSGGDVQWRGDWYPATLIRGDYFPRYAEELAEEIGAIKEYVMWPHTCIDWERAAEELRVDYTPIDINEATYWYR